MQRKNSAERNVDSENSLSSILDKPDILKHQLYDDHLPKLADAKLIDWADETGAIARGPRFDAMREQR